jgi:RHS repeat-associated protein
MDGSVPTALTTNTGTPITHWNIIANGQVVGRYEGATKKYYWSDHLGSTRVVVDNAGTVLQADDYYPFGLKMPGRSFVSGALAKEGFTSKERDSETGLDYFGARYYMPALGRWGVVDPLAESYPGWSAYNFVMNNPTFLVDPNGLEPNKRQAGTLNQLIAVVDKHFSGRQANLQLLRYTERAAQGRQVGPFGGDEGLRYVYTSKRGWLDLAHLFQAAAMAQAMIGDGARKGIARTVGRFYANHELWKNTFEIEEAQAGPTRWSYEDAPSNKAGLDFFLDYYKDDATFMEALVAFLESSGIVDPENAPNWNMMQSAPDNTKRWFKQNFSFDPVLNPESEHDSDTGVCEARNETCN